MKQQQLQQTAEDEQQQRTTNQLTKQANKLKQKNSE